MPTTLQECTASTEVIAAVDVLTWPGSPRNKSDYGTLSSLP